MAVARATKNVRVDIRIPASAKSLIAQAAKARHQSLSEFMLQQSIAAAEMALLDQRVFMLDDADWDALNAMLDAPARELPELSKALSAKPIWDR